VEYSKIGDAMVQEYLEHLNDKPNSENGKGILK